MATITVDIEIGGQPYSIDVQADNEQQAIDFVSKQAATPDGSKEILNMVSNGEPEKDGIIKKAWDALAVPEKMSREGLGMLADLVPAKEPTGNMALDLAANTPKIAAETLAEAAPGFISPESILTAGTLKGAKLASPLLKAAGKGVAKGAEAISGLEYKTPGVLTEAARDPRLLIGKGKNAARKMFEGLIDRKKIRPDIGDAMSDSSRVDAAIKALKEGTLTPEEALLSRQSLDAIKKSVPKDNFARYRDAFDSLAKKISKTADVAFSKAVKSDALRNLFPQNKLGGTSIAKSALGSIAGAVPLAAMSPFVQGSLASLIGLLARGGSPLASNAARTGSMVGGLANLVNERYGKR